MMRTRNRLSLFLLLPLTLTSGLVAQKETLLIGPGDLLHLLVYDTPEMEQRARVTDAGQIPFSFLGNVTVAGLTPEQASEQIQQRLIAAGVMLHPQVTVRVEIYATLNASVMGQVQKPGPYEIDTPRKVVDVLALAGGLTDLADRHITIQRFGPEKEKVEYFFSNSASTALSEDPLVYPGDTVIVPKPEIVYVLGDVAKPGGYPINTNNSKMTVLQAIALAGYANHTAAVGRSKLVRENDGQVEEINLEVGAMQKGKKPDVALLPDDVVYVPFSYMRNIAVNGQGILASVGSAAVYAH
jgi:polysaccharide export outer membrane protein